MASAFKKSFSKSKIHIVNITSGCRAGWFTILWTRFTIFTKFWGKAQKSINWQFFGIIMANFVNRGVHNFILWTKPPNTLTSLLSKVNVPKLALYSASRKARNCLLEGIRINQLLILFLILKESYIFATYNYSIKSYCIWRFVPTMPELGSGADGDRDVLLHEGDDDQNEYRCRNVANHATCQDGCLCKRKRAEHNDRNIKKQHVIFMHLFNQAIRNAYFCQVW